MTRWSEKSTGLKILWAWTFGTAAILITNVMRTRMHDMDKLMNEEDAIRSEPAASAVPIETILKDE